MKVRSGQSRWWQCGRSGLLKRTVPIRVHLGDVHPSYAQYNPARLNTSEIRLPPFCHSQNLARFAMAIPSETNGLAAFIYWR